MLIFGVVFVGQYLPEEEHHGKRDWPPPYSDYPDPGTDIAWYIHVILKHPDGLCFNIPKIKVEIWNPFH